MKRTRHRRRGLSLLEVILAIIVLGGALVAVGELMRLGSRAGSDARNLTTAQILCESKMSEIAMGLQALESVSDAPFDDLGENSWTYSVELESLDQSGFTAVRVTVTQEDDSSPVSFTMVRWMPDPAMQQLNMQTTAPASSGTSGSASGGSRG